MRVPPLGDSITDGWRYVPGRYPIGLWERLVQADHDKIDFVGSLHNGPPELGAPRRPLKTGSADFQLIRDVAVERTRPSGNARGCRRITSSDGVVR